MGSSVRFRDADGAPGGPVCSLRDARHGNGILSSEKPNVLAFIAIFGLYIEAFTDFLSSTDEFFDMELDRTDVSILHHLEGNGRITNQELAEAVGLSASACFRRVKLLEERGVIAGYRCVIGAKQVGIAFEALVHVSMRSDIENWHENFVRALNGWAEVVTARIVTGTSNYVLTVRTRDLEHFSHFVIHKLHKEPGVMAINSNIVLETLKSHGSVLDLLG